MSTSVRQGKNCALIDLIRPRSQRYQARARDCNPCPLKAQSTTSKQGRSLCRSVDEACLDRVRAYQLTEAYKKVLRKRQVCVVPLFAEAKDRHGMQRFRGTRDSGESIVRPYGLLLDSISNACSKSEGGDAVRSQQRPCVPSFWLLVGGCLVRFWSMYLFPR
jgi:hypothetical protein